MSGVLYTTEILRLAASTGSFARLPNPSGTAEKRSPICGSRVTVDVALGGDGRVVAPGMDVRACALGQASAALLERSAPGKSVAELERARGGLRDWLAGAGEPPPDWPGLDIFEPARAHSARHPAILLAFDAVAEAAQAGLSR